MTDNQTTQDGQGLLVGVTPAQPQNSIQWSQARPDQDVSQRPIQLVDSPPPNGATPQSNVRFTDEDIERARQQEKDKLYPRIDEMSTQLKALQAEREAEQAERLRLTEEAEEARKAKEESEMDLRQLFEKREAEFNKQINDLSSRYDADRAVFDRERALQEAYAYRIARIEQEQEYILPELRDMIGGDTPDQIDASIEEMKARTEAILANMTAAAQPQPFRGAAMPSVPPVGPMEQMPQQESLTADDIRTMDMDTYKRYREQLLRATNPQRQRGR